MRTRKKQRRRLLLREDYRDTLAAGSVNGTRARPGRGWREVIDTENKLSVDGTNGATFAGGMAVPAYGDPAVRYAAQARLPGVMLIQRINRPDIVGTIYAGYPWGDAYPIILAAATVNAIANGQNVGPATIGAGVIDLALIMRATGMIYLYRVAGSTFKILGISDWGTGGSYQPTVWSYNDPMTVPFQLVARRRGRVAWGVYDTFTAPDGTLLHGHVSDGDPDWATGIATWRAPGAWGVSGNAIARVLPAEDVGIASPCFATARQTSPDVVMQATLDALTAATELGLVCCRDTDGMGMVNNAGGYAAGATEIALDGLRKAVAAGDSVKIGAAWYALVGVGAYAGGAQTITLAVGLAADVADDASVQIDDAAPNYMQVTADTTNLVVRSCVAGVVAVVSTTARTWAAGAVLKATFDGTNLYIRWVVAATGAEAAVGVANAVPAALQENLYSGIYSGDNANRISELRIIPYGTEGQYDAMINREIREAGAA